METPDERELRLDWESSMYQGEDLGREDDEEEEEDTNDREGEVRPRHDRRLVLLRPDQAGVEWPRAVGLPIR